jgi:hypothetical protein
MSESTEWVKLPEPKPKALPAGTQLNNWLNSHTMTAVWVLETGHKLSPLGGYKGTHSDGVFRDVGGFLVPVANRCFVKLPVGYRFEGSEVVKDGLTECTVCGSRCAILIGLAGTGHRVCGRACADKALQADDLGDTPEHLRSLLAEARKLVPGTLVSDETEARNTAGLGGFNPFALWRPTIGAGGYATRPELGPQQYEHYQDGAYPRFCLKTAIREGRAYPTDDARRIGRKEFGMVFEDGGTPAPVPTRCLTSPIFDTRPTCSQCAAHMDARLDGDDTCSSACHQAKLGKQRAKQHAEKHEQSERVYKIHREHEFAVQCTQRGEDDYRRLATLSQPQRIRLEHTRPLNPAALPGVCGVRGRRKELGPPVAWPPADEDEP